MKLRNLFLLAIGIAIGYAMSQKMHEDDPAVLKGPQRSQGNPGLQLVSSQAQRLADQASIRSLDAIRRARGVIRSRLADSDDDAVWN